MASELGLRERKKQQTRQTIRQTALRLFGERGFERIVNLGDTLYGPLDPAGTARRLLPLDLPTVRGNGDRAIVEAGEDAPATVRYTRDALSPKQLAWLCALPATLSLGEILLGGRACAGAIRLGKGGRSGQSVWTTGLGRVDRARSGRDRAHAIRNRP